MGGIDLRIHTDGEEVSGHFLLAVASNIHLYAGGIAEISPYARLDDGEMDLWLFAGDTWLEAITHAWDLLYGRHLESDRVRCIPFRQIALSSDSTLYIQMDGEPMGSSAEVNIEVRSRALRILVPDNAPRTLFSDVT